MQTARTLIFALLLALPCAALAQDRPTREDEAVDRLSEQINTIVYDQQPRRAPFITKDGKLSCNGTVFPLDWRDISKTRRERITREYNEDRKGAK